MSVKKTSELVCVCEREGERERDIERSTQRSSVRYLRKILVLKKQDNDDVIGVVVVVAPVVNVLIVELVPTFSR